MSAAIGAVRAMLTADAALTAQVPATRITAGEVAQDTAWPAIVLMHQYTERQPTMAVSVGEEHLRTEIEVMPIAQGYAAMDAIVQLIEGACNGMRGTYGGVSVYSTLRTSIGADEFFDEQGLWARPVVIQVVYTRPSA